MSSTFADLGVSADVTSTLARRGIEIPTPIQHDTVAVALAGRDVAGRAPTGSGKTLAFGIPLTARIHQAYPGRPTGLVLVPTRELAAQVERELRPLLATRGRSSATFYGGVGFAQQTKALRRGVDLAVACPGRLADLVRRRDVSLEDVEVVVIDEADRMADMGFLPEVRRLLDQVRDDRQTLLFSATLDGDVDVLVRHYQQDPHRAEVVAEEAEIDLTAHEFVDVRRDDRVGVTARLVTEHGPTVVFCRTRRGADRLAQRLAKAGTTAAAIHGGRSQGQRDRALASFAAGRVSALVATDVAARGIHVDDVACVIHFDLPGDAKDYVHRSGRTGRAGAAGRVVTLVTETDRADARRLQQGLDPQSPAASRPRGGGKGRRGGARGSGTGRPPAKRNGNANGNRERAANRDGNGQRTPERNGNANGHGKRAGNRNGNGSASSTGRGEGAGNGNRSRRRRSGRPPVSKRR